MSSEVTQFYVKYAIGFFKICGDYPLDDAFTGHICLLRVGVVALIPVKKFSYFSLSYK